MCTQIFHDPRLKRAVLWTLALTALSLVAAFGLLSWARVRAVIGLLYIGDACCALDFIMCWSIYYRVFVL
ncbi:hypothetical protein WJX79_004630 [Trebouxia sp. C0005]